MLVTGTDSGIERTLSKSANDSKLCSLADVLEGSNATQNNLDSLEWGAHANVMKFNEAKCRVLDMGWGSPRQKCRSGREWIENSPGEKDLGTRSLS